MDCWPGLLYFYIHYKPGKSNVGADAIHYKSDKSNVEADRLSRTDWEKCSETIQVKSIQAVVTAAMVGDLAYIKAVSCSKQAVESFLPIQYEPTTISKVITWVIQSESYDTSRTWII